MLGNISIEKREVTINAEEVLYWKRMIKSNLKIGVEIETCLQRGTSNSTCRDELTRLFKPTGSYGKFGDYGVMEVKGDGSLDNGIELCTIGRRLNYIDLYSQYEAITSNIIRYNPIMNERAGLHNHMLMDYGDEYNSLEKPMPGVIFKNFVQLIKRHLPELVYLTSTVNKEYNGNKCITRMDRFCTADTLVKTTPLTRTVEDFKQKLSEPQNSSGRYKFINTRPLKVTSDGNDIERFHIELRFPDGSIYPAQIASQNILYASILLKAVELSECGIINCGNAELWEETKTLYGEIRNCVDQYDNRVSSPLSVESENKIKLRCKDMLLEFKPQIDSFDTHTFAVLKILSETPISVLRRTMSDIEINTMFKSVLQNMYKVDLGDCVDLIELINLSKCIGSYSEDNWCASVARKLAVDKEVVKNNIFKLRNIKELEFDKEIGAFVFK